MKTDQRQRLLTLYGRKPVLEALQNRDLEIYRLHLADSNRREGILLEIEKIARERNIDIRHHSKLELSRISKNSQQDQGVAIDIQPPGFEGFSDFMQNLPERFSLIALDGITNPQNLGMIIRSACAGHITGILLPTKGCARLDALVIKASAGTLFKARIIHCENLPAALLEMKQSGSEICLLDSHGQDSLYSYRPGQQVVYVLGNETSGPSESVRSIPHRALHIPMNNGVESLNVAMVATLISFFK